MAEREQGGKFEEDGGEAKGATRKKHKPSVFWWWAGAALLLSIYWSRVRSCLPCTLLLLKLLDICLLASLRLLHVGKSGVCSSWNSMSSTYLSALFHARVNPGSSQ